MPTLLEQAIIDAKTLREAALKNAEDAVINKYSDEVRQTLNNLLEQEEDLGLDLGGDMNEDAPDAAASTDDSFAEDIDDVPYAAEDNLGNQKGNDVLGDSPKSGETQTINLDLGALAEHIQRLTESEDVIEITEDEEELEELKTDDGIMRVSADAKKKKPKDKDKKKKGTFVAKEEKDPDDTEPDGEQDDMENASNKLTEEEMDDREKTIVRVNGEDRTVYRDQAQLMRDFDDVVDMGVSATKEGSGIAVEYQVSNADAQEAVEDILGMEMDEDIDFDALADAIMEKLSVDMGATLAGWAGRSAEDMKHQMELELAHRRSTDMQQELEDLKKAQEELVFENKRLTSELSKYRTAIGELKESVQDINLSNARLLYTNRVLRNTSLNERQKDKIVEAISKSDSVAEARTIYNTLQSTVQSTPQRGPKSLSEAINRPSSLIRATRKESAQPTDVFSERMKRLASII
jgi:hypothetical protein